jgi:hypothetical protein
MVSVTAMAPTIVHSGTTVGSLGRPRIPCDGDSDDNAEGRRRWPTATGTRHRGPAQTDSADRSVTEMIMQMALADFERTRHEYYKCARPSFGVDAAIPTTSWPPPGYPRVADQLSRAGDAGGHSDR